MVVTVEGTTAHVRYDSVADQDQFAEGSHIDNTMVGTEREARFSSLLGDGDARTEMDRKVAVAVSSQCPITKQLHQILLDVQKIVQSLATWLRSKRNGVA